MLWCSGREQRAKEREKRHPRQAAVIRPSPMIVAADDDDNITGTLRSHIRASTFAAAAAAGFGLLFVLFDPLSWVVDWWSLCETV